MLFKKLFRTMGLYKAQFISMIIMIALGIGVFVGFNMEWVSIEKNTAYLFEKTNFADYRIVNENGFSKQDLEKIAKIKNVTAVSRFFSVNVDVKNQKGDSIALDVTENENVSGIYLCDGEPYNTSDKDGIWLSGKYAAANNIKLYDKLTLVYKNIEINTTVKGLVKSGEHLICVRDSSQLMPDYNTFGFGYISPVMYKNIIGKAFYPQINVLCKSDKKEFTEAVDTALKNTTVVLSKDENVSYSESNGEIEEGKTMGAVLPVLFLLIAVLTMVTTMHRLTAKEKTQIGTLKALGFKDRRILRHYTSYAFAIGVIGSVIGIGIGLGIAYYIMNPDGMMGTYMDLPQWKLYMPWFCTLIIILMIALLTFIGFLSVKKMLKGTAADALRPYTPKAVKPLAIEKTALFHRLSFGTRWNMRDIMRHKSRTAMSLIGIVGCMVLMVGSMGMSDTMDAFLKMYYDDSTNYSSRIFLLGDASSSERRDIINKYNGDYSAGVSVQIDQKAVSLDIYSTENGKVRFPNKKSGYAEIGDDGAYICLRLAKEFKVGKGDTITVCPYGQAEKYTLKISGLIRSVSENIVISPKYAETLGIDYKIDSVYTSTEKSEISMVSSIKSVQSKQMIMDSFNTFTDIMNSMIIILVLGALLLGVVVLYNLGTMSYSERYREMATLKVVGFKDKKIGSLLIGQNLWLSAVGVIIGIPAGIATLGYLLSALAGEYEMRLAISAKTIILSTLLTFLMSLTVSLMVSRKNKKIDMVEALKGAE